MFPIRDDNPHFLTPVVTYAIIALNTASWFLLQGLGGEPALASSVCTLGLIPGELLGQVPAGTRVELGPGAVCVIADQLSRSHLNQFSTVKPAKSAKSSVLRVTRVKLLTIAIAAIWPSR